MLRRAASLLVFALFFGACTQAPSSDTGSFSGEEGDVAELVAELSDAAGRREPARVCDDLLSAELQSEITGEGSCIDEVEKAFDDADVTIIDVDEVTVEGDEATAEVSSGTDGDRVSRTFTFVREDDSWRISSFG